VLHLLQTLESSFQQAISEQNSIQSSVNTCHMKLSRAQLLLSGLATEQLNWSRKL
jgi:hypothetical protein